MSTARSRPSGRILVVDDEPEICQLLTDALGASGMEVTSATCGAEAVHAARSSPPDLVVADLRLGDCDGVELMDRLRKDLGEIPVVIISGHGSAASFSEASRLRPVELLNKPIDLERLRQAVRSELERLAERRQLHRRYERHKALARDADQRRRKAYQALATTCTELTATCRDLQGRMDRQEALIRYQGELLSCTHPDDAFSRFFRLFVQRSGPVFGLALLCDENAELQMVGRFGVPIPDGENLCRTLAMSAVNCVLERPEIRLLDAQDEPDMFPSHIHKLLIGVTLLLVPLMAGPSQLIGLVLLYRKGEQPFTEDDVALAAMIAPATATSVQKA
jgi:CheY-like chemotaxis protein